MQYFHQSHYGSAGAIHTAKPQFVMKGNSVYATIFNKDAPKNVPLFNVENNSLYTTIHHKDGEGTKPIFSIIGGKIHTTVHNSDHKEGIAAFELKDHL